LIGDWRTGPQIAGQFILARSFMVFTLIPTKFVAAIERTLQTGIHLKMARRGPSRPDRQSADILSELQHRRS
jgi:hypothetical protein